MSQDKPARAGVINADREPDPGNPHTWLPLVGNPPGTQGLRVMYGVLRPIYRGWTNTAVAFGRTKIQVVPSLNEDPWEVTAARAEVVLPTGADDRYLSPQVLLEAVDEPEREPKPALLAYATVTWPTQRLHEQYEVARSVFSDWFSVSAARRCWSSMRRIWRGATTRITAMP